MEVERDVTSRTLGRWYDTSSGLSGTSQGSPSLTPETGCPDRLKGRLLIGVERSVYSLVECSPRGSFGVNSTGPTDTYLVSVWYEWVGTGLPSKYSFYFTNNNTLRSFRPLSNNVSSCVGPVNGIFQRFSSATLLCIFSRILITGQLLSREVIIVINSLQ